MKYFFLGLCKCTESQICFCCKILTVVFIALAAGAVGYFIGKNKGRGKGTSKQEK